MFRLLPQAFSALVFIVMLPASLWAGISPPTDFSPAAHFSDPAERLLPGDPVDSLPDTVRMDAVHVRSTRLPEPAARQPVDVQRIDSSRMSLYESGSVAAALSRHSGIYVRDNGPGGMATLSQRGLSPSQTQVLWEGVPINTPSLGLSDLSMIPAGLFESVEVSPGNPSSAFGGGSLGGTVYLSSGSRPGQSGIRVGQTAGAFGTLATRAAATRSGERTLLSVKALYRQAENDFSYHNRATGRQEQRRHNAGRSGHLAGRFEVRTDRGRLYSRIWLLDSFDEIPGTVLSGNPQAEQGQRGGRGMAGADLRLGSWRVDGKVFVDEDRFTYDDPSADIESRFRRGRGLMQVDLERPSTGRVRWSGGFSGGREYVRTNNYADRRERFVANVRVSPDLRFADERIRVNPTLRLDHYSDFGQVMSPSLGLNLEVLPERLYLRGMASRDFNPPSFNDLYWVPSGNPDLVAETSRRIEGGAVLESGGGWFESIRLTGYRIWLTDGIYWFPSSGGNWTPDNVEEVDAYGVEAGLDSRWTFGRVNLEWSLRGEWRRATVAAERFDGDQAVGRQMRYVPEWSGGSHLSLGREPVSIHLDGQWTGRRFVTADHTSSLAPFREVDLTVQTGHEWLGADWRFRLAVRNLLDESYEIIQWYPMPGRYLEASVDLSLW